MHTKSLSILHRVHGVFPLTPVRSGATGPDLTYPGSLLNEHHVFFSPMFAGFLVRNVHTGKMREDALAHFDYVVKEHYVVST